MAGYWVKTRKVLEWLHSLLHWKGKAER